MKTKKLGRSSLSVSTLCLGGNVFGWTVDQTQAFQLLDAFVEFGGNFIDTADVYSRWIDGHQGGESETILGRWLKERKIRSQVIIATKVGMEMSPQRKGLSKKYIVAEVEESLRRLQTDYIDLYISHRQDPSTQIAETLEAYDLLIKQGKVRVCGASNYDENSLREAMLTSHRMNLPSYQSLQPLYNLYDRAEFEKTLQPICEEFSLGVTPYYGLAAGFLTGKYRAQTDLGKSPRGGGMGKYMNERGERILNALDTVAQELDCSPATVALAWLMSRPVVTAAIASATTKDQLKDLVAATETHLSSSSLALLDQASST